MEPGHRWQVRLSRPQQDAFPSWENASPSAPVCSDLLLTGRGGGGRSRAGKGLSSGQEGPSTGQGWAASRGGREQLKASGSPGADAAVGVPGGSCTLGVWAHLAPHTFRRNCSVLNKNDGNLGPLLTLLHWFGKRGQ